MRIKNIILLTILLTSTIWSQAQQINAVPDYVFRNQMSVGRNAVTDTAAYFSIGPRYGATKGFMPPIVGDTATFSSGKRNGLLIFSVQKNKFLYWDSVRVQWSDMAGSSGAYIVAGDTAAMLAPYLRKADTTAMLSPYLRKADTATISNRINLKLNISDTSSMLTPYVRHAGYGLTKSGQSFLVDTLNIATRAWRQKGLDSLAALEVSGSGTTNYVPKFTASSTIGNSQIFDNGTNVGIGTGTPSYKTHIKATRNTSGLQIEMADRNAVNDYTQIGFSFDPFPTTITSAIRSTFTSPFTSFETNLSFLTYGTSLSERLRITSGGNVGIATQTPSALADINGVLRVFNASGAPTTGEGIEFQYASGQGEILTYNRTGSAYTSLRVRSSSMKFYGGGGAGGIDIFSTGRIGVNTTTDAGYQFDVNGTMRTVNGANFATTSGNVGIGTASPSASSKVTISTASGYGIELDNTATGGLKWQIGSSADDFGAGGGKFLITYGNNSLVSPFTIVQSTSNIGIATTSPSYKLDVNGTLRSVNGANFATTSGNVGIGTASPAEKLEVVNGNIQATKTSGEVAVVLRQATTNFFAFHNGTDYGLYANDYGTLFGRNKSTGLLNIYDKLYATSAGNIGIGTSSPTGFSDKIVNIYGSTSAELHFTTAGTGTANSDGFVFSIRDSDGLAQIMHRESASLLFGTGDTEAGRINSAREWLLSSGGTDAGDYKLQVSGNIYNTGSAVLAATSGKVGIGTTSPGSEFIFDARGRGAFQGTTGYMLDLVSNDANATKLQFYLDGNEVSLVSGGTAVKPIKFYLSGEKYRFNTDGELWVNTQTDAGDYKLQVVGNARVGTGKLDIASNTTFGLGVARSGTSEVAGQIYNSNGILYLGAESSAGGQIFSGSAAYAGVIGTGANYPLQFATNNTTRATIDTDGDLGIATTTPTEKLDVNGRARIRTIDSTSTAINLLYADVDGVIKKAPVSASGISGSGTTNYIPKFTSSSALGNSILYENNSELFINTTSDQGNYKLQVNGTVYNTGQFTRGTMNIIGYDAQLSIDSTKDLAPIFIGQHQITTASAQPTIYANTTWNTTGSPTMLSFDVINTASGADANWLRISDGVQVFKITKDGGLFTGTPTGGSSKKWRLGSAATVSPTSPNRTIQVEVDGVIYYLHAKTTND